MRQLSKPRRRFLAGAYRQALALAAAAAFIYPAAAAAQPGNWPGKPIRLIVPFPAGSFTDTIGRVVADGLSKGLGQPVIVENKAGANGMLGVSEVARADPDGYTLLVTNSSSITINPQLYKKIPYKPSQLTPITTLVESPFILVINPEWAKKNKIETTKDLVAYARAKPGELTYGSAGPGNAAHLSFAMMGNHQNFKATHVPYKGASLAEVAVLSGEIDSVFDVWSAIPQIRTGKLKALAVSSDKRVAALPDVPSIQEGSVPDFNVIIWAGLLAPAGTPEPIKRKLFELTRQALQDPKAQATLSVQGEVVTTGPEAFQQRIDKEIRTWGEVIRRENITLD
ncbi:ABC transporter substrate-binding protein [Bordetella genomosp. 10]|uniref:ABC transporter substrate-binding protein n=1 Tax=Bordetella genomosp. 10 TaxID=1416804 RepID=A0A261SMF5_9BORD|nr:tripartite tricarboxylate transporter substrate binding protein [Bordetella genomosp. 10]OZI38251.1 ABC transporter substrate-binding protein [Bordetella genomosp. 10]